MVRLRAWVGAVVITAALLLPSAVGAAVAGADDWQWPLSPQPVVLAGFHPPAQRWGPGHRGIDLGGSVGQRVSAIGAGRVSFTGVIAGRGVVVVDHGALRSTYEPVSSHVTRGQQVAAGQIIATLESVQSHCSPQTCLHLGVRRGETYLDPLTLLGPRAIRLKPLAGNPSRSRASGEKIVGPGAPAPSVAPTSPGAGAPTSSGIVSTIGAGAVAALTTAVALRRRRSGAARA